MRILIVEDSEMNLEIVRVILMAMGHDVIEAHDGNHGFDLALAEQPDLILTDYHMPGMTGIEMVQKIRVTPGIQHIPVIAMTADIYAKDDLMQAGCDAYLAKPIRKGSLLRTIHQVYAVSSA